MEQKRTFKIVYCIPSLALVGGGQRILAIKANYFATHLGYEIHIVTTDNGDIPPFFHLDPSIKVHNLNINYDRYSPVYKRLFLYIYKRYLHKKRLKKCLAHIKADFTILMLRRELSFIEEMKDGSIKLAENHFEKHSYLNNANYSLLRYCPRFIWERWQLKQLECLKKIQRFIVLTHEDAKQWNELDNLVVIPNPLTFLPTKQSPVIAKQVIAVGRMEHQKGFDLLIDAWKIVAAKYNDWNLKIYGNGPLREELQLQINDSDLSGSCTLEYPVTDIAEKYAESSIFVLSSRFEGFGLVIIEAMSCGLPVVTFDCPCGPKDIITDHEDGILVKTGDVESLARQISYLIENEDIRKTMGEKALVNVQKYKIENIAVLWEKLFNELWQEKQNRN